jgi:hypothetical protein
MFDKAVLTWRVFVRRDGRSVVGSLLTISSSATLYGTVKSNGIPAVAFFEWGRDSGSLSWQTPPRTFDKETSFAQTIMPLPAGKYFFRAKLIDAQGSVVGETMPFTICDSRLDW